MKRTELHEAAANGRLLQLGNLIHQGSNVNAVDEYHFTPLHDAVINRKSACAKVLLKASANPNARDICNRTPLYFACCRVSLKCCELLLDNGAVVSNTIFQTAINCGCKSIVQLLVQSGAKVTTSCLSAACWSDISIMKTLLLSSQDAEEFVNRALHVAVQSNKPDHVKLLLEFGANPFHKNDDGQNSKEITLTNSECFKLLDIAQGAPHKLLELCRIWMMRYFRSINKDISCVNELPLPHPIAQYLMYNTD
uniref:SOCS box domain-containing protein n=1 Tax=Ciona savignyi TaxID=51511 RepID=H2ZKT6_CIOSA